MTLDASRLQEVWVMGTKTVSIEELQLIRLAERFSQGDGDAFGQLYARLRARLLMATRRILGDDAEAEDVVQDTFIRAWKVRERLRDPARVRAWLTRIAVNLARTRWSRRGRCVAMDPSLEQMGVAPVAHAAMERAERRATLSHAIDQLTPRQSAVITLRVHRELSFKEIAHELGCSNVSARVNYTYGVQRLRERMVA